MLALGLQEGETGGIMNFPMKFSYEVEIKQEHVVSSLNELLTEIRDPVLSCAGSISSHFFFSFFLNQIV